MMFDMCFGAFRDEPWFCQVTTLVPDPDHRALHIDLAMDWWYVDDLAMHYLEKDGRSNLCDQLIGRRILAPESSSDGYEILRWLTDSGAGTQEAIPEQLFSA